MLLAIVYMHDAIDKDTPPESNFLKHGISHYLKLFIQNISLDLVKCARCKLLAGR